MNGCSSWAKVPINGTVTVYSREQYQSSLMETLEFEISTEDDFEYPEEEIASSLLYLGVPKLKTKM